MIIVLLSIAVVGLLLSIFSVWLNHLERTKSSRCPTCGQMGYYRPDGG